MTTDRQRVLIVGGGVGGLEAALALHAIAPERFAIRMLSPSSHFTYRPLAVGEPFGHGRTVAVELARVAEDRGFELVRDGLARVEPNTRRVTTQSGATVAYDALILAVGARVSESVTGALTFRGPDDVERFRQALEALVGHEAPRIVFATGGGASWTLPLYELALMTAEWAAKRDLPAHITIVTAEPSALYAFGEAISADVSQLLRSCHISVRTLCGAGFVGDAGLHIAGVGDIPADLVVALPALSGPALAGLPADSMGFIQVDGLCRVRGLRDVYAVGDAASHAIKQGGLAAQQADVAARVIASRAGEAGRPEPYEPVLRGLLLTGGPPLYLRSPQAEEWSGPAGDPDRIAPWWPPHKIVGAHLAPYLATHADLLVSSS